MSRRYARIAAIAFVAAYFLYFAWDGLHAGFAADDMMNLHGYWKLGPWHAVYSQFLVGSNVYRPLGALFYLPIYTLFGLNPLPFRIVILALLALNTALLYRVARELGASPLAAVLATLVGAYHAGMADLHHNTAVVYDILCFGFYWAAFLYYTRARRDGRTWGVREYAVLLVLALCALNSKEMAVTLPLALMAWEWLYAERRWWPGVASAAALTAIAVIGKLVGADALITQQDYRPVFTLGRFLASSSAEVNHLLYAGHFFTPGNVVALWAVLGWVAWRRPRPVLRFTWLFILFSPLPVVFLDGRLNSCLYLPLAGWAIFVAVWFEDLAQALAAWLENEPLIGRLGRRALFTTMTVVAVVLLARMVERGKRRALPSLIRYGAQTAAVIDEFRRLNPHVKAGSRVLILDDPFHDWDAKFIAELWFADRSVEVWLQNKTRLDDATIAREVQAIFRFEGTQLTRVR